MEIRAKNVMKKMITILMRIKKPVCSSKRHVEMALCNIILINIKAKNVMIEMITMEMDVIQTVKLRKDIGVITMKTMKEVFVLNINSTMY